MSEESNVITVKIDSDEDLSREGVRYTAYSSIGCRSSQQDSLFAGEKEGEILAVICDGMGGMEGGERASGLAVQMMIESFYSDEGEETVPAYFHRLTVQMDEAVCGLEKEGTSLNAGTTIVALRVREEGFYWLSVGDSRIYLYRKGQLICPVCAHNYRLLLDRKLASGKISQEEYEKECPRGEALISYLGIGGIRLMELNQNPFIPEPGDQVLLCSDGLYKSLTDEEICDVLKFQMSLEVKAKHLVDQALEHGGAHQDNTSVILLQF